MIKTFDELEAHTRTIAARYPAEAAEIILAGPGLGPKDRKELLSHIRGLPESYLECAQRFNLLRVRSGYFAFWPEAFDRGNLVQTLLVAASITNPQHARFSQCGVVQVASWEADPIVITLSGSSEPGGCVAKFSVGRPTSLAAALAPDFGVFMLLVGNLDKVAQEKEGREAIETFRHCFDVLAPSEKYWSAWEQIAAVVLLH